MLAHSSQGKINTHSTTDSHDFTPDKEEGEMSMEVVTKEIINQMFGLEPVDYEKAMTMVLSKYKIIKK